MKVKSEGITYEREPRAANGSDERDQPQRLPSMSVNGRRQTEMRTIERKHERRSAAAAVMSGSGW